MTRAVTFDLDDTLTVVDRDRETILAEAARAVGAPPLSREAYLEAHAAAEAAQTRKPIFEVLLSEVEAADVDPAALTIEYRRRIAQNLRPVRGAEELLETLAGSMLVGLITNGPEQAQWEKLERLGWTDHFDTVVISGRVGTPKPDPRPFEVACDRLEVDPTDVLHIGDHPIHDIEGARQAGLAVIQVVEDGTETDSQVETINRARLADELPHLMVPAIH